MPIWIDPLHGDDEFFLDFDATAINPYASCWVNFHRTPRIPDDGQAYTLRDELAQVRRVADVAAPLPPSWIRCGGVILPLHTTEALWLAFLGRSYPFAIKIGVGGVNALTGARWSLGLQHDPQDYLVTFETPGRTLHEFPQPLFRHLGGAAVAPGVARQLVALPRGQADHGDADWGELQVVAYPMKRER
jgi:hypothetical protein